MKLVLTLAVSLLTFYLSTGCAEGTYGPQCQQPCMCANGAACDHVSGACTCTPGWRGTFCDKRKFTRVYGQIFVIATNENLINWK